MAGVQSSPIIRGQVSQTGGAIDQINSAGLYQSDPQRAAYLESLAGVGAGSPATPPPPSTTGGAVSSPYNSPTNPNGPPAPNPLASPSTSTDTPPGAPVGGVGGSAPGAPASSALSGLQNALQPPDPTVGFTSAIQGLRQGLGQRSPGVLQSDLAQRKQIY